MYEHLLKLIEFQAVETTSYCIQKFYYPEVYKKRLAKGIVLKWRIGMTDNEKKVLKAFYQAVCDGPGMMDRVTSKKLGMALEEFREIVNDFIDYGFLPGHYSVRGGRGNEKGWDSQGNQLSQEAIEIAKEL